MEWAAVIRDGIIGLLIAGAVAGWVPVLAAAVADRPAGAGQDLGTAHRPIVAVLPCNGGISLGGVQPAHRYSR
jgi:hypothetical protein